MSFNIYNTLNQSLNSKELQSILSYATDNYSGVWSTKDIEDLITISGTSFSWEEDVELLSGGILLSASDRDSHTVSNGKLYCIKIDTNEFVNNTIISAGDNVVTYDELDATIEFISSADEDIVGWYKINIGTETYNNMQTIKIDDCLYIPLVYNDNGSLVIVVTAMDKTSLEAYLTSAMLKKLMDYINSTFVWHSGGLDASGTSTEFKKGDVGGLNITDKIISSDGIIGFNALGDVSVAFGGRDSNGALHTTDGKMSDGELPIAYGGTSADNRKDAKSNLGIKYGVYSAEQGFENPTEGDIYLKIVG